MRRLRYLAATVQRWAGEPLIPDKAPPGYTPLTEQNVTQAIARRTAVCFIREPHQLVVMALESNLEPLLHALFELSRTHRWHLRHCNLDEQEPLRSERDVYLTVTSGPITNLELVAGSMEFQLQVQIWSEMAEYIEAPCPNFISNRVWRHTIHDNPLFEKGHVHYLTEILAAPQAEQVSFDVDVVYTWVNGDDPDWQELYAQYRPETASDGSSMSRFHNRDELMYSLRALEKYAPWVRKVHIVSNCTPPDWLETNHPKLNWVDHTEIFEPRHLPTFSSHAIETRLHKIPGLSNHFIYSNDDFLFSRPSSKSDFFEPSGLCKLKLEKWGNVNGQPNEDDPDYLNGARNAVALLQRDFGCSPTRLHCHAPQALRVDILEEMEARYADAFERTASQKFRSVTDIAVTGFFFHHYAYITGRAYADSNRTLLIQQNHNFKARYERVLRQRSEHQRLQRYLSVCVNDGKDSHLNTSWNRATMKFLNAYLPHPSLFEKNE